MERRYEVHIETRFEAIRASDRFYGVGVLRNLSRSGAWMDEVSVRLPMGARVRIVILDIEGEERDPVLVDGVVVRRSSMGFAVEFHPFSSSEVGRLLDRLAEADRSASARSAGGSSDVADSNEMDARQ